MTQTTSILQPTNEYPYNLGSYSRRVSTKSADAQVWFTRGLIWAYAFHHEEATKCFEQAIAYDPDCAIAYWGLAYAAGPHYNRAWNAYDPAERAKVLERCNIAIQEGLSKLHGASRVEAALLNAIQSRFPQNPDADYKKVNVNYASAMEKVYAEFGSDLDVAVITVDAVMNIDPWNLWDIVKGVPTPGSRTEDIGAMFDRAMKEQPTAARAHPGLLHFYIHYIEMSPTPEAGIVIADHLRGLVPDSGHLNHMPSHLDVLIGDYRQAIAANAAAVLVDEKYQAQSGPTGFYTIYRLHVYHTLIYAAMFNGQYRLAIEAIDGLEKATPDPLVRMMPDFLEFMTTTRMHIYVRFGKWKEILDTPLPSDPKVYCTQTAMIHYAKGIAYAVQGDVQAAEKEQHLYSDALQKIPSSRRTFPNKTSDVMAIGESMLDGEIKYRRGEFGAAFESLREAVRRYDGIHYSEPWGWMQPTRHAYAALQLEQGNVEEAAKAYAEDLGIEGTLPRACQHPLNVWALHGYHECLQKLGRVAEAKLVGKQLVLAQAIADTPIRSSCYCRRSIEEPENEPLGSLVQNPLAATETKEANDSCCSKL
jgi:tetratricopeptide (TPR) repeat protein